MSDHFKLSDREVGKLAICNHRHKDNAEDEPKDDPEDRTDAWVADSTAEWKKWGDGEEALKWLQKEEEEDWGGRTESAGSVTAWKKELEKCKQKK